MIYWFTGQPGHGKTLHAICKALDFKAEGRLVFCGNINEFDYKKTGFLPITPEEFRDWPNFLPNDSVCLIDEAYEHGMLPKRPPGSKVPYHVEQLAKHRHRGIDFIFVSQSPKKQVDDFVHDLIEQQVHVRRLFGLPLVRLKIFDRFEANPNKAEPITLKRVRLPKRAFGLYKSTTLDTTQLQVPWYAYMLIALLVLLVFMVFKSSNKVKERLGGEPAPIVAAAATEDGAPAKADGASKGNNSAHDQLQQSAETKIKTTAEYVANFQARIPSQPWSAPAYDGLQIPNNPPRIFCAGSGKPIDSCHCITDQGTKYNLDMKTCITIVTDGQYEPYLDVAKNEIKNSDAHEQLKYISEHRYDDAPRPIARELFPINAPAEQASQGKTIRGWMQ